jgi:SAM-dependent methyltransferase
LFRIGLPGDHGDASTVIVGTSSHELRGFSDAFQYPVRERCKRRSTHSSLKQFVAKSYKTIVAGLKRSGRQADRCSVLLAANLQAYYVCDSFDVTVALQLMRLFSATKVLDFCAGWGDRLIAAIAGNMEYTGVDINREVFPGYAKAISTLVAPKSRKRYVMINEPAETADIPGGAGYDLVFTSPPYFASEEYSPDAANRNVHDRDVQTWFCKFMMPALQNAWAHLKDGGHMLIALSDAWDELGNPIPYTECMNLHIGAGLRDASYVGCVAFRYPYRKKDKVNPVWVWKKTLKEHKSRNAGLRRRYTDAIRAHYPRMASACPLP